MYQHGLDFGGADPDPSLGPLKDLQISEGYAVAASSYRQRGWALFTAPDDNAELLTVFKQLVGTPGAIVPFGASLGGLISLKMAEDSRFAPVPGVYAACPPAAGTRAWDEAIDLRLAYDVICKGAGELPTGDPPTPWAYNLGDIPSDLSDLQDKAKLLADVDTRQSMHRHQPAAGNPQRRDETPSRATDGRSATSRTRISSSPTWVMRRTR